MLKYTRYALAAIFFAASVGCLALWWERSTVVLNYLTKTGGFILETESGMGEFVCLKENLVVHEGPDSYGWQLKVFPPRDSVWYADDIERQGNFGFVADLYFFPLWYPALVFALAGVGVLRFRRQFSIRTAMIGLAVVAALLAMVVAL